MKFHLKSIEPATANTDCVIVGIYEEGELTPAASLLNKKTQGFIKNILKQGEFQGKIAQTLLIYDCPAVTASRVLLVGCGKKNDQTLRHYRKIIAASIRALGPGTIKKVVSFLTEYELKEQAFSVKIKQGVLVSVETLYQFTQFK